MTRKLKSLKLGDWDDNLLSDESGDEDGAEEELTEDDYGSEAEDDPSSL